MPDISNSFKKKKITGFKEKFKNADFWPQNTYFGHNNNFF